MSGNLLWFLAACSPLAAPPVAPAQRVGLPASQTFWAITEPEDLRDFGRSVTSGDFNGDGVRELVIGATGAGLMGVITLWDVSGDAPVRMDTLPAAPPPVVPGGTVVQWGDDGVTLAVTDLNNDGYDDLIAGDPWFALSTDEDPVYGFLARGRVVVRLGGPAGLGAPYDVFGPTAGTFMGAELEAVGDVNGDGFGDVVASYGGSSLERHSDIVVVIQGRADGLVDLVPVYDGHNTWPDAIGPGITGLGDVNGDGRDDIAWTMQHRQPDTLAVDATDLAWVAGSGAISLTQSDPWRYTQPGNTATLQDITGPGDLNGDGAPDLIVGPDNVNYEARWFANTGGTFPTAPTGTLHFETSDQPILAESGRSAGHVLAPGDVDGDGHADLVAFTTRSEELLVYRWSIGPSGPDALPTDVRALPMDHFGIPQVTHAAGDLNLDGRADLVITDGYGTVHIVWGDGPEACGPGDVPTRWFLDDDGDGFASDGHARLACVAPAGASAAPGLDCDDDDALSHPGAVETLGFIDQNCDGQVVCNIDHDGDGFGGAQAPFAGPFCDRRWHPGVVSSPGDCDDTLAYVYPRSYEYFAGHDVNCDGLSYCYTDLDDDGSGTTTVTVTVSPGAQDVCTAQLATFGGDCDDLDPTIRSATTVWYPDADRDGYGASNAGMRACQGRPGTVTVSGDCNDANPLIHVGRPELLNGEDEDCDGQIACYEDRDHDHWGTDVVVDLTSGVYTTCWAHPDGADESGDCDDAEQNVHPGLRESPATLADDNCNGANGLTLQVSFDPGPTLVARVLDSIPSAPSAVFVSLTGPGAGVCPGPLGGTCLGLSPAHLLDWDYNGPSGDETFPIPVPAQFSGSRIWLQAATSAAPGVVTNIVETTIP